MKDPIMGLKFIPISKIRLDNSSTQIRVNMDPEVIAEYRREMKSGTVFPHPEVFEDEANDCYWIGDGHYRITSMKLNGKETVECLVRSGSEHDAFMFALKSNRSHGVRLTSADKEKKVRMLLESSPAWMLDTIENIMAVTNVGRTIVRRVKDSMLPEEQREQQVQKRQEDNYLRPTRPDEAIQQAPETEEAPEELLDGEGRAVQGNLVEVFAKVKEFRNIDRVLVDLRKRVEDLSKEKAGHHINMKVVSDIFKSLRTTIKECAPYSSLCAACKIGSPVCPECNGRGWMPLDQWKIRSKYHGGGGEE